MRERTGHHGDRLGSHGLGVSSYSPPRPAHRRPPDSTGPKTKWLDWVNEIPTYRAFALRCLDIELGSAEFDLEESVLPLAPDGTVVPAVLVAAADMVAGAVAARASPHGRVSVTATLFGQVHARARIPVKIEAFVEPGNGHVQSVRVVAHGETGAALTMSLTMVVSIEAGTRPG